MRPRLSCRSLPLLGLVLSLLVACVDTTEPPPDDDRTIDTIDRPASEPVLEQLAPVDNRAPIDLAAIGQECGDAAEQRGCPDGLTCVTYWGVAGPSAPAISSCELPCGRTDPACPSGTVCTSYNDGPGKVCEPK